MTNHYIESKAVILGCDVNEITTRLPKSYGPEDIDAVCESLQSYELNMSKLPFNVDRKVKVRVHESIKEQLPNNRNVDDDIDPQLMRLVNSRITK